MTELLSSALPAFAEHRVPRDGGSLYVRDFPGNGPAFAQMTSRLVDEIAANTSRLLEFRRSDVPLLLVWGRLDPYLHVSVADYMRSQAMRGVLHVLEAGHWPQIDASAEVARIMLAGC